MSLLLVVMQFGMIIRRTYLMFIILAKKINAVKMSYAASSYGMAYKDTVSTSKSIIEKSLKDFNFIGVRDDETYDYIKVYLRLWK